MHVSKFTNTAFVYMSPHVKLVHTHTDAHAHGHTHTHTHMDTLSCWFTHTCTNTHILVHTFMNITFVYTQCDGRRQGGIEGA